MVPRRAARTLNGLTTSNNLNYHFISLTQGIRQQHHSSTLSFICNEASSNEPKYSVHHLYMMSSHAVIQSSTMGASSYKAHVTLKLVCLTWFMSDTFHSFQSRQNLSETGPSGISILQASNKAVIDSWAIYSMQLFWKMSEGVKRYNHCTAGPLTSQLNRVQLVGCPSSSVRFVFLRKNIQFYWFLTLAKLTHTDWDATKWVKSCIVTLFMNAHCFHSKRNMRLLLACQENDNQYISQAAQEVK